MSGVNSADYPVWALLPKRETGVSQFLTKYPEYDGRGVVIAIFDSGVDPGAPGLQITSDGKVKVVERYDCSGAGDVDTSVIVSPIDGVITGVTGRKLTVPESWENPSGVYHIGAKNAFELYSTKLKERIQKKRKETMWDPFHREAYAAATRDMEQFSNGNLTGIEKLNKEDKETALEMLTLLDKKFTDLGPTYDCVVFHDGTCWRACIDTSEAGNLCDGVFLGEYSITHEYAPLTEQDLLNVSINVYDNGNVLEICSMCAPHGTHVASIAASYFPDDPMKNGIAPGAQIISLSIGDGRLTSMETGTALVRAMIKIMQRPDDSPVHVINMSYGEHSNWSCSGRIGELMEEVVRKYNVTWIGSAGNQGPALCTISTPPDIKTDCIIGVGAYISPDMMIAEYGMLEKTSGMPYTWSSRGPTIDGGIGVSICAPGGAITSVPNFTLRGSQLLNGTSMAAPHVSGAVALMLSGLLQNNHPFSPFGVKRALENTALFLSDTDVFAQGYGLLQVEKAFDHLTEYRGVQERDVHFKVQFGVNNAKGVHFRSGRQDKVRDIVVNVDPVFPETADKQALVDFNLRLSLVSSTPWVQVTEFLDMSHLMRSINVRIDPTGLKEGVHSTSIRAYDVSCIAKGPVFQVPVTVVKPTVPNNEEPDIIERSVLFQTGMIRRHFILVPEQATWIVFRMKCLDKTKMAKFVVHGVQLLPKQMCKSMEFYKMFLVAHGADIVQAFPCRVSKLGWDFFDALDSAVQKSQPGGIILELAITKFWSSLNDIEVDYDIEFRGIRPNYPNIVMQAADGVQQILLTPGIRVEEVAPVISLKSSVLVLKPAESKILACCKERDVIPPSRQIYQNILTYNIMIWKSSEVTPACHLLCDSLYESEFESQLWMLFDSNKMLLATGDAYPNKYSVKLEKGEYVLKLDVRHEKRELLEKLSEMPIHIHQKLCTPISLDVYLSPAHAITQGKKISNGFLTPGTNMLPVYIGPSISDKSLKSIPFGQYLSGTISYAKDELGKKADTYKFKYIFTEPTKKNKVDNNKDKDKDKTKSEEFEEALREFNITWLGKLEPGTKANEFYETLKTQYPDNLQVHIAMLASLDPMDVKRFGVLPIIDAENADEDKIKALEKNHDTIMAITSTVIQAIDSNKLLSQMGMKNDARPDSNKTKLSSEKIKIALVEALARQGCAQARANAIKGGTQIADLENWKELMKFVDPFDLKVIYFMMWHASSLKHYARVFRMLLKLSEEKPCREIDLKVMEIAKLLGWSHVEKFVNCHLPTKYPSQYRRF